MGSRPDEIVVKETKLRVADKDQEAPTEVLNMDEEAQILTYLHQANSNHTVRMIGKSHTVERSKDKDPLEDRFNELRAHVGRLYFEYCPLKDLCQLIKFRQAR